MFAEIIKKILSVKNQALSIRSPSIIFLACRLALLDKNPRFTPIEIGQVLHLVASKVVAMYI